MQKTRFILIISLFLISCNPAPNGLAPSTQNEEKPLITTTVEKEVDDPNLISSTVKMVKDYTENVFSKEAYKKDPAFEAFFKRFCEDSIFCQSRTITPYKEQVFEIENDAGETEITTNLYKKCPYDFKAIKAENKGYRITIEGVRNDTASVMITLDETGVMIETIFIKRNNEWFALETNDYST